MRPYASALLPPTGLPAGRQWVLALTLGLHLLALLAWWAWLGQRRPRPPDAPQVVSILLQPHAAAPAPVSAPPVSPSRTQPRVRDAARVHTAPAAVTPPSLPDIALPDTPLPDTPPPDAATAEATWAPPPAAPAPSGGSATFDNARRRAGQADRALRKGRSGVPVEADTPWARFQRGLEAAHVEPGYGVRQDSYTAPDGVVIYRTRIGNRTVCRRSGSVGPNVAGMRGVNDAGPVSCPTGVEWRP